MKDNELRIFKTAIAVAFFGLMTPSLSIAQSASGQLTTRIAGKDFVFTIVSQADEALGLDDADAKSAFAPQSEQFAGIVSMALWATEDTSGIPFMLNIFHRVSGEPTEVDQFSLGFSFTPRAAKNGVGSRTYRRMDQR